VEQYSLAQVQPESEPLPEGWIELSCVLPEQMVGGLVYDSLARQLLEKPRCAERGQVFDLDSCSWVMPASAQWEKIRRERDVLMASTDWRVVRAMESGQPLAPAWAAYRQALRDVTQQPDPFAIVWPAVPGEESTEAPTDAPAW
jgi:hypothetical protein